MFTPLRVRISRSDHRALHAFRPTLHSGGSSLRLEARSFATFFALGTEGLTTAVASSVIAPAYGDFSGQDVEPTGPSAVGATASSQLSNVIRARQQWISMVDFIWIDQVTLTQGGSASATVLPNTPGTSTAKITLDGDNTSATGVTVIEGGPWQLFPVLQGEDYQGSAVNSTTYTWQNLNNQTGVFDPNATITVDLSVNLTAQDPNFTTSARLTIITTQFSVYLDTGFFANLRAVPGTQLLSNGLTIVDSTGGILGLDPSFNPTQNPPNPGGGSFTGHWTFPPSEVESLQFSSEFNSGPQGTFDTGYTESLQALTYSLAITASS